MSEAQHTPGPWETDNISVRSSGPDGRQICLCEITVRGRPYDETYDEAIANAHLIAAAPALLAAVRSAIEQFDVFINSRKIPANTVAYSKLLAAHDRAILPKDGIP